MCTLSHFFINIFLCLTCGRYFVSNLAQECIQNQIQNVSMNYVAAISMHPRIFLAKNFLSSLEISHFLSIATDDAFMQSQAYGKQGNRFSKSIWLNRTLERHDGVIKNFVERLHDLLMIPVEHGEILQIAKYDVGEVATFYYMGIMNTCIV